ncbi:translation initiation factor IF-2-like [Catharus ustulatus]|uniref:translation initiation factor IF-2-like n=1 Tax=Catharus ustulatus TaxID=91951 RepID=UPI00140838B8|nr:translation initiation factor IF-2-like [Catharus ustulatus]
MLPCLAPPARPLCSPGFGGALHGSALRSPLRARRARPCPAPAAAPRSRLRSPPRSVPALLSRHGSLRQPPALVPMQPSERSSPATEPVKVAGAAAGGRWAALRSRREGRRAPVPLGSSPSSGTRPPGRPGEQGGLGDPPLYTLGGASRDSPGGARCPGTTLTAPEQRNSFPCPEGCEQKVGLRSPLGWRRIGVCRCRLLRKAALAVPGAFPCAAASNGIIFRHVRPEIVIPQTWGTA